MVLYVLVTPKPLPDTIPQLGHNLQCRSWPARDGQGSSKPKRHHVCLQRRDLHQFLGLCVSNNDSQLQVPLNRANRLQQKDVFCCADILGEKEVSCDIKTELAQAAAAAWAQSSSACSQSVGFSRRKPSMEWQQVQQTVGCHGQKSMNTPGKHPPNCVFKVYLWVEQSFWGWCSIRDRFSCLQFSHSWSNVADSIEASS